MADTVTLQQQIEGLIKATADGLELKTKEQLQSIVLSVETINQRLAAVVPAKDFEIVGQMKKDLDTLNENLQKNQEFIDNFIKEQDKRKVTGQTFNDGWKDVLGKGIFGKKEEEITKMVNDRNFRISMDLKVADMTNSSVMTGDVVQGYNSRQGLVPSQNWNFRDILTTTSSPTGSFVTYRETGTSGSISVQTEGSSKTQIDYAFTEVKTVSKFIAGFAVFSKQLMYNLPFLNQTLPRMLLRDFYKKENDYLYDTMVAAATGSATTPTVAAGGPANDIEEIIFWIANQRSADYNASYGIIDWADWAHLMKTGRNSNSTYALPLSAQGSATGDLNIAGTPIRGASWADAGEFLLWDNDFVERVETESLRVEFSFEDNDNFRKNLVTARVECYEELNILRPNAIIHGEFGGS
jgi:hypothetical protein